MWPWVLALVLRASRILLDLRSETSLGQCSLLALWRRWWLQMIFFVKIAILDPALWIILSNVQHLDCVSNKFCNVLSEEQCNHHEVSRHLVRYQMDSKVWKRLLVELCHSLFPPRIIPLTKMDWDFHEISMWKIYSFQLCGTSVYSIISGLIGIPKECSWIARR